MLIYSQKNLGVKKKDKRKAETRRQSKKKKLHEPERLASSPSHPSNMNMDYAECLTWTHNLQDIYNHGFALRGIKHLHYCTITTVT